MKIYISHATSYDYEAELYAPIKASELYAEHQIFLPHESQNININMKDLLGEILAQAGIGLVRGGERHSRRARHGHA